MRDVVELQIEENVEAKLLERLHDLRTLSIVERHAHLEPLRMAAKLDSKAKRRCRIAIESDDHAVASGHFMEVF